MTKNIYFLLAIAAIAFCTLFHAVDIVFKLQLPINLLLVTRLVVLIMVFLYSINKKSLSLWIFFALILGVEFGYDWPEYAKSVKVLSDIFLRLIKTLIAPLIFSTLVVGIAGHSNIKQVGRMGLKSIIYFELVTTFALAIGLITINLTKAGVGFEVKAGTVEEQKASDIIQHSSEHHLLLDIFPENISKAIYENQILQVVIFSILFGISLSLVTNSSQKQTVFLFVQGLSETMFKFTNLVMYMAPIAVGAAMAYTVSHMGIAVLGSLMKLVASLYLALVLFVVLILFPVGLLIKLPFKRFFEAIAEPVSIAFATASSEAALPTALTNMKKLGIPENIVAFVLPTGYSFNLDGTTLYLSLASVFIAQSCGIDLSVGEQIQMCLVLMLTSKGVAGVRGASFLILVSTVSLLGLDPQKAFVILAVDALMDMGRTSVNVLGNCLATYVVAFWEKEI